MITLDNSRIKNAVCQLSAEVWDYLPPSVQEAGAEAANGYLLTQISIALATIRISQAELNNPWLTQPFVFYLADLILANGFTTPIDEDNDLTYVKSRIVISLLMSLPLTPEAHGAAQTFNYLYYTGWSYTQEFKN